MSTEVDVGTWWAIVLAPGAVSTWWYTWGFDSNHWVRFDGCPDSDQSKVQILTQWAEKDIHGTVFRKVRWKNNGATHVRFRPRCIQAPNKW